MHHLGNIHSLKLLHLGSVVHAVERRDVLQERGEAPALGITPLEKHLLGRLVDMGIVDDGLEIALNAGHRGLELMGYVLRELSLEHILFAPGGLQPLIDLDDLLGNLAQLIVRKGSQIFDLEALVMLCPRGENLELCNVGTQPVDKPIEHNGEHKDGHDGKPHEVLVGLQDMRQIGIIGQRAPDDEAVGREIGGRIEEIAGEGLAVSVYRRPLTMPHCRHHFGPVGMVGDMRIVLGDVVEHHPSVTVDDCHTHVFHALAAHIVGQLRLGETVHVMDGLIHAGVVILQPAFQKLDLILLLPIPLKDDERDCKYEKDGQNTREQPMSDRYRPHHASK